MSWVWLLCSIGFEVAGTLSLRATNGFRKPLWLISVVTNYAIAFVFLGLALASGVPVGIAYGLWTAIGIVLIALFAKVIWNEPLTRRMLAGIALIAVGVILIELG